jgi:NAD(P)-dependent dehydrogenase (short-subunit alcohol dehydrogenase family)
LFDFRQTGLINRPARLVYLSSGLHRGGEGSLRDLDWPKRTWDPAKAYAESKLQVVALAFAVARRWPQALSNAVDPGWVRTKRQRRSCISPQVRVLQISSTADATIARSMSTSKPMSG